MSDDEQKPNTAGHTCADCGKTADVLAAFWGPETGPFDEPSGYACIDCRPSAFEPWMRALIPQDSGVLS